jgi:hypothetical protein
MGAYLSHNGALLCTPSLPLSQLSVLWGLMTQDICLKSKCTDFYFFFFDSHLIVHREFLPPGQTVNYAFYKDVSERLRKRVQRVRKNIAGAWVLHHDKAPGHTALSIREFLAKKNIPTHPHPPHSPHLAQCNHFGTVENIQRIVTYELRTLIEYDFRYCNDQWKERWNHCVTSQGSYFGTTCNLKWV